MTPFLGQISSYRVKGHRKDFSQWKIVNKHFGGGSPLIVFIHNVNYQHITKYGGEANQDCNCYLHNNFCPRAAKRIWESCLGHPSL